MLPGFNLLYHLCDLQKVKIFSCGYPWLNPTTAGIISGQSTESVTGGVNVEADRCILIQKNIKKFKFVLQSLNQCKFAISLLRWELNVHGVDRAASTDRALTGPRERNS